jgi:hypothetical protein
MVNIIGNIILDTADVVSTFITNIWNLISLNWENDTSNWEA